MDRAIIEIQKVFKLFNEEKTQLALGNNFEYIYFKSFYFIENFKDNQTDFSNVNNSFIQNSIPDYEILDIGCSQVLEGKGLQANDPFTDLGVLGFYTLFEYFNYSFIERQTKHSVSINENRGALDKITFKNNFKGDEVTYYNFCMYT